MQYVGLSKRFNAALIDLVILFLVSLLYAWLQYFSWQASVALAIPSCLIYPAYKVWFHARWGKSIGKRAVRIHAEMADGRPLGWRGATARYLPLILYGVLSGLAVLATIRAIPPDVLTSATWMERGRLIRAAKPTWQHSFYMLWFLWLIAEVVVLETNTKKRAIHDFMAGTIVVQDSERTS